MKKTKHFLLALVSVVMASIVAFAVGCDCKKKPVDDGEKTLQSIELDTSNAKLEYLTPNAYSSSNGETYTSEGLVIKATFGLENGSTKEENILPTDKNVFIDTSAIKTDSKNHYVAGTYEITVHYTYEWDSESDSYQIEVKEEAAGLDVKLKSGVNSVYTLSTSLTSVDFSDAANWIEVRKPDAYGNAESSPVLSSGYEVKVYLGKNEISGEALKECGPGAYAVWAFMPYDASKPDGYILSNFAIITVNDTLQSLTFKSGEKSQTMGADIMTPQWKFTAKFESGIEKEVDVATAGVEISGVNTRQITSSGSATVSYSVYGVKKTLQVPYTILKPTHAVTYHVTYASDGTKLAATWGDDIGADSDLAMTTTVSSFKTSTKSTQDGKEFTNLVEIKDNKTVTLTFGSAAEDITITIYVSHNNTSNTREAYIKKGTTKLTDAEGNDCVSIAPEGGVAAPYAVTFSVSNLTSGTYLIDASATVNLYAIEVTYTVDYTK